jgi:acyl-coenzyme A synthetase/AMP-(fatty) acid ligase
MIVNATQLFLEQVKTRPDQMGLWIPRSGATTFAELAGIGASVQKEIRAYGLKPGDNVLLVEMLNPRLYGILVGLMASGIGVVLVEPWMPVSRIDPVIRTIRPKAFITNTFGKLWGSRVKAIRQIPLWLDSSLAKIGRAAELDCVDVDPSQAGIITFTSGTTGMPKGMVRHHGYLAQQYLVLSKAQEAEKFAGPDLCIFANFALSNLASGRGSVIIPSAWKPKHLAQASALKPEWQPETLTCGPAFLLRIQAGNHFSKLKSIHVGGALTDCAIFEKGFAQWPEAEWHHLYGSTEVEPVAIGDARVAVKKSRERGYFQTLWLGKPISEITADFTPDTVWVTGPHVSPKYLANEEENRRHKRQDEQGRIWHRMGDRVREENGEWWYRGRENQPVEEFDLEQKIYSAVGASTSFVVPGKKVFTQKASVRAPLIREQFPEVSGVLSTRIVRDRRHRARIDRVSSQQQPWWKRWL